MLLYDMDCKGVVCVMIFAIVHGQGFTPLTSLEESEIFHLPNNPAAVSVNPKAYNYFIDEVSSKSPLPRPNVYIMSLRQKRSPTLQDLNCLYELDVSEEEYSRRQDNKRFSRKGATKRVHRSTEDGFILKKSNRKEKSDASPRPDKLRRNERNDHDRHGDGSRTNSNAANNHRHDRERNHHNDHDHNHHNDHDRNHHSDHDHNNHHDHHRRRRDKPNSDSHSNSRHDRHRPQPSTPNDKKGIFTKNVIKS